VREWLADRTEGELFRSSVGQSPSLADVLKMVHPKPATAGRAAFYGYLLGRDYDAAALPEPVRQFERFKAGKTDAVPDLPFTMLAALPLETRHWVSIARRATWQTTRMNLNTFARHGVFADAAMAAVVAARLRDSVEIRRARVFPYQLLAAYRSVDAGVPTEVRNALQDAMEIAVGNVPAVAGLVVVCPDVSGSMVSPVTGDRQGATTSVRCIDVAGLVTAAMVRKNDCALVLPFAEGVREIDLNPRDTVLTNAAKLAALGGGGTNCSAPIRLLNKRRVKADLVMFVSDNQSWVDSQLAAPGRTAVMAEWAEFRQRNPQARLVCLDVQPYETTQAVERADILNIGGFADSVFEVIAAFASGELEADHWMARIEAAV
jgi:60 kDa SS-A/Ro ribonucleoprotein